MMEQILNFTSRYHNFQDFYEKFKEKGNYLFPVAHRGCWKFAPENSLSAIQNCMNKGVFIIELDVHKTKDGKVILMHDDSVDRMTNGSGKIADLTLEQIKALFLKKNNGGDEAVLTNEKVPTLLEAMNLVKDKALVNIDKCWDIREEVYEILEQTDTFDHALIKSDSTIENIEKFLNSKDKKLHYMHKVNEVNVHELEDIITKFQPIAIEISFQYDTSTVVSEEVLIKIKENANVWVNSLDLSLNGGHSDTLSLVDPDAGWGWLVDKGMNIIQTDYSFKLLDYLDEKLANHYNSERFYQKENRE